MKRVTLEQFPQEVAALIVTAQRERVVITRDGQPYALIVGVENKDAEDLQYEFSPEFWKMIEERRREPTVRLRDAEKELFDEQ